MRTRIAAGALALSALGFVGIVSQEGYTTTAIRPVPNDPPTNGFGSTTGDDGQPLALGEKTDPVRAARRAVRDLNLKEKAFKQCLGEAVPLYQHEYDAYADLTYNVGAGAVCKSSIIPKLQAGFVISGFFSSAWIVWQAVYTVATRVLFVWIYNNSGRSLFSMALCHWTFGLFWVLWPQDNLQKAVPFYEPSITAAAAIVSVFAVVFAWSPTTLAGWRFGERPSR